MGLDTTHDAWHGAYSGFNRFRYAVAEATGIDLEAHWNGLDFTDDMLHTGNWEPGDPLFTLLNHSDCEGHIVWQRLTQLADRLESLLPNLEESVAPYRGWGPRGWTEQFIHGCRDAVRQQENLGFH